MAAVGYVFTLIIGTATAITPIDTGAIPFHTVGVIIVAISSFALAKLTKD